MKTTDVVVLGATGNIGRPLAQALIRQGKKVRAVGRHADRLKELADQGADPRVGDLTDLAFLTEALRGAATVFAMVPPDYGSPDIVGHYDRMGAAIAAAIRAAGVPRAVSLSSVGAHLATGTGPIVGLHRLEEHLNSLPATHVIHLRPTYFMENHLANVGLIKAQGIHGGAIRADAPFAMIATRDIAAAAAPLLAETTWSGRRVQYLLGERDLTMAQAARALGAAIGKPDLVYVQFPDEAAHGAMLASGLSADVADKFIEMSQYVNRGGLAPTEPRDASSTTPTSIEEFARSVFAPIYNAS